MTADSKNMPARKFRRTKMSKKIIAIVAALLIAASLCACGNKNKNEGDENNTIDLGTNNGTDNPVESGDEIGTGNTEIGDPGEYSYTDCDQTVYVNNPDSAVSLRSETYELKGSVPHGTELHRIGLSTDEANYWSKVIYEEETYYVASKFLTTLKNADEGFVNVDKTVVVSDETGSLNIRNLPTFDGSQVIGWAVAGIEIKVVAENAETGWYKIEFVPYGSTEAAYGYIVSDAKWFVQDETATDENDSEPESEPESDTTPATESAGK